MTEERTEAYYRALLECGERYRRMANCSRQWDPHLEEFCDLFIEKVKDRYPLMKLNRWLGYIQGVLIEKSETSVAAERNWTRPLFRPLDFE
jgi:hypothetical protein